MRPKTYTEAEVKIILEELYERFVGRLSDGEDSLYAKLLKRAQEETEEDL